MQAVPSIGEVLWFDEQGIDIGDEFHPKIQQALAEARVGILLLSNRFLTSNYIRRHELPYLLQQAEQKQSGWLSCISPPFLMRPSKSHRGRWPAMQAST